MIVLHSVEFYIMYSHIVISSPFSDYKISMLSCQLKHKHTSFGVEPEDHYIPLPKIPRLVSSPLRFTECNT
jgi:hypothetical protein